MTTGLAPMADRMRATLPDYSRLAERAAVHGLIEFDHGRWINDPDFQRNAMANVTMSRPLVRFKRLKQWLDRVGVLEDLDDAHGRSAVQFLRFVLDMATPGGALECLINSLGHEDSALLVTMLTTALNRPHDGN